MFNLNPAVELEFLCNPINFIDFKCSAVGFSSEKSHIFNVLQQKIYLRFWEGPTAGFRFNNPIQCFSFRRRGRIGLLDGPKGLGSGRCSSGLAAKERQRLLDRTRDSPCQREGNNQPCNDETWRFHGFAGRYFGETGRTRRLQTQPSINRPTMTYMVVL